MGYKALNIPEPAGREKGQNKNTQALDVPFEFFIEFIKLGLR